MAFAGGTAGKRSLKWPQLYDPTFWAQNRGITDVDIGRAHGIPNSTVRKARQIMHIKPIAVSEASRRTWERPEFRKARSRFPQLYDLDFWEPRKNFSNSEIAKELECGASTVKSAREFLGFPSLTPSQAQSRRWRRDLSWLSTRRQGRRPMDWEIRERAMARVHHRCEVPICDSPYYLEAEHIIDVRYHGKPSEADYLENMLVLCLPHHDWWSQVKVRYMHEFRSAESSNESPRGIALEVLDGFFPMKL